MLGHLARLSVLQSPRPESHGSKAQRSIGGVVSNALDPPAICRKEFDSPVSFASPARPGSAQGKLSAANDVQCFRRLE